MKKGLVIALCFALSLALLIGGAVLYIVNTPEYALAQIVKEVREIGIDAVIPNLTDNANKKISPILSIAKNNFVQSILSFLSDEDYASMLIDKAQEIDWSVGDIIKNNKKASVTIRFNYDEKIQGSIDLELLKIDGKWQINDLYNLNLDKPS